MSSEKIRLGTRGSALARWQTNHIIELLQAVIPGLQADIEVFTTKGDQVLDTPLPLVGDKGLFTAELEAALQGNHIDFAVHSLKDLPTKIPSGLAIGSIPVRANPSDVLVSRGNYTLDTLPTGAKIGTSSTRRAAQLLNYRSDLQMLDIRGNVDTRVHKVLDADGQYDAVILAYAGLERLERLDVVRQVIPFDVMLPAPGQGALAVQCRDEAESLMLLQPINHRETELAVTAERAFLAELGGGCSVPISVYADFESRQFTLRGRISSLDGSQQIDVRVSTNLNLEPDEAAQVGKTLAQDAFTQGAASLLKTAL